MGQHAPACRQGVDGGQCRLRGLGRGLACRTRQLQSPAFECFFTRTKAAEQISQRTWHRLGPQQRMQARHMRANIGAGYTGISSSMRVRDGLRRTEV